MLKNNSFEAMGRVRLLATIVVTTLLLSACGGLTKSNSPAVNAWWLTPLSGTGDPSSAVEDNAGSNVLVLVSVVPGLDTANVLTLSPNAELSHYTGAHWADELPELLNSLVGRTLESAGGYQVVSRRSSRNLDRCVLRLEVEAFYAELDQSGSTDDIYMAYSGEYRCDGVPSRFLKYDARTPVAADKMGLIVASFQTGLNAALEQLLEQIQ